MAASPRIEADVAVVGAGAAGLFCALTASGQGARVALISATPLAASASYWAQGGLAAALAPDGTLALGLEGGHSVRRVAHAGGSATGRRILRQLSAVAAQDARILVVEGARAASVWRADDGRCVGVGCEDGTTVAARGVVLAAGGTAALWSRTTNPPGSTGTGMLLAHAAGAALADLEFLQFHPTAVTGVRGIEGFLITEAIRG